MRPVARGRTCHCPLLGLGREAGSPSTGARWTPLCSDLTLTQVLTVFTDGEAEAQRWEQGQAWGRERKVGVPAVLVRPSLCTLGPTCQGQAGSG